MSPELPADATTIVPAFVKFLMASVYKIFGFPNGPPRERLTTSSLSNGLIVSVGSAAYSRAAITAMSEVDPSLPNTLRA